MEPNKKAFAALAEKLRNASLQGDWESVSVLDVECRALVAALRDEDALDRELREQLDQLSRLYAELQKSGRAERERLATELIRLNQSSQVKDAYKPLG